MSNQHSYQVEKVCAGNYGVHSSIGRFSVHKLDGRWFVRLDGLLIDTAPTKKSAMVEVRRVIRTALNGETIRVQ